MYLILCGFGLLDLGRQTRPLFSKLAVWPPHAFKRQRNCKMDTQSALTTSEQEVREGQRVCQSCSHVRILESIMALACASGWELPSDESLRVLQDDSGFGSPCAGCDTAPRLVANGASDAHQQTPRPMSRLGYFPAGFGQAGSGKKRCCELHSNFCFRSVVLDTTDATWEIWL